MSKQETVGIRYKSNGIFTIESLSIAAILVSRGQATIEHPADNDKIEKEQKKQAELKDIRAAEALEEDQKHLEKALEETKKKKEQAKKAQAKK